MKEHVWIESRNKRLSAMLHLPESFKQGMPLVVCCHGFTGNKVGYNHLTLNLAVSLENSGYGALRFDFLGSGDSDGDFSTDTVVSGWQQDLINVLHWVESQEQFSNSPIILYGHSLGGLIVLTYKDLNKRLAGRIVFAPVTSPIENFKDVILKEELWSKSLAGEKVENFFDKAFTLESQFVQDLVSNQYEPISDIREVKAPLLVIHGQKDAVVPISGSQKLFDAYQGIKEFAVTEFDHGALGAQKELQSIISSWLERHQALW